MTLYKTGLNLRNPAVKIQDVFSSFLTIPNAFEQCTITLLINHSAIFKVLKEKLPRLLKVPGRSAQK